jgi:hypothetical protein
MVNIRMPKTPIVAKTSFASAAELALKAHAIAADDELICDLPEGDMLKRNIGDAVNLMEAPEDAVCALVTDLLHYCDQHKIDWTEDVMSRAQEDFRRERTEAD